MPGTHSARWLSYVVRQPLLGLTLAALGLFGLALAWTDALVIVRGGTPSPLYPFTLTNIGLAVALAGAVVAAQAHPVHVARAIKLYAVTTPLYLLAVLIPPSLAAASTAIAVLIGELAQRRTKGSFPSDIATSVGRLTVVVLLSSVVAHLTLPAVPSAVLGGAGSFPLGAPIARLPLFLAAGVLYLGDTLTGALEISAITGETPFRVVRTIIREGWRSEALQCLAGIIGAMAARQDAWAIVLLLAPALIVHRLLRLGVEMQDETRALLESMADAVDLRDTYTGGHSRRVTAFAVAIMDALELRGPEVELITAAARVHDIGKIAIPDRILNKPDRLTDEERREMESHPQRGAEFLARYADFQRGIRIVLHHHERIDGAGYPHGLSGDDIPFGARVIAVADAYDAMTSDRPYRQGMSITRAGEILVAGAGTQWDNAVVAAFTRHVLPSLLSESQSADPNQHPGTVATPDTPAAPPSPRTNAVA